jgi:hypothetical protein
MRKEIAMPGGSALIQADAKDLYASWRNIESAPRMAGANLASYAHGARFEES